MRRCFYESTRWSYNFRYENHSYWI